MAFIAKNITVSNLRIGPLSGGGGNGGGGGGSSEPSYLAVGASRFSGFTGRAFVFDATNYSTSPTVLQPSDLSSGDRFGISVATTNDYIVVGAQEGDGNVTDSGAAYVYNTSNLSATPTKLAPSDGASADYFGNSVAASADYIVVGAPFDDDNSSSSGGVYVYNTSNLSASPTKLVPSDNQAGDNFGYSVAISGNHIVVGARRDSDQGSQAGAVYVYDTSNLSANPTKLVPSTVGANDEFGHSVAVNSSNIVVGAWGDSSVYVFDATSLSTTPTKLTKSSDFGTSVAVTDTHIIVGDRKASSYRGSAYVYDVTDLSASPVTLVPNDTQAGDEFGTSVSAIGSQIVVGSYKDDDAGGDAGAAYIYDSTNLSAAPTKLTGLTGDDYFGVSVSLG